MDTIARRCVTWAVVCFVVGAVLITWFPSLINWLSSGLMRNENAIFTLTEIVLAVVRWTAFPVGGALVASAVVISWLRKHLEHSPALIAEEDATGENH